MNVHLVVKSTDTARGTLMLRFLVWMKKIKYSYFCLPDPSQNLLCPSLEISVLLYFVQHKHKYLFGNWRGTELNRELKQCLKKKDTSENYVSTLARLQTFAHKNQLWFHSKWTVVLNSQTYFKLLWWLWEAFHISSSHYRPAHASLPCLHFSEHQDVLTVT